MSATSYVEGPAGLLEARLTLPSQPRVGQVAVVCHPHPLFGGTMNNKVVTTLERALRDQGLAVVTFNFRGVGQSAGTHDHGRGEIDDCLAVVAWARQQTQANTVYLAGFSFGSYIAAAASQRLPADVTLQQLLLIAPPVHHYPFVELSLPASTRIFMGDADEVVPAAEVFAWAKQQQLTLIPFAGCSHFFHGRLTDLRQCLEEQLL